jgi:hypothetical protein
MSLFYGAWVRAPQSSKMVHRKSAPTSATLLANSIFDKGDIGAIASPEVCVIFSALYPNMVHKVNVGALLIQHFR